MMIFRSVSAALYEGVVGLSVRVDADKDDDDDVDKEDDDDQVRQNTSIRCVHADDS